MSDQSKKMGKDAEIIAAQALKKQGYQVIKMNYTESFGEVDIIARHGSTLCFLEVKARTSDRFGAPLEAISLFKRRKICSVAASYLNRMNMIGIPVRFDVLGLTKRPTGGYDIELLQDAFDFIE